MSLVGRWVGKNGIDALMTKDMSQKPRLELIQRQELIKRNGVHVSCLFAMVGVLEVLLFPVPYPR